MFLKQRVAQKDTSVYYLNNAGAQVTNKADAYLFLMILPPDPNVDKKLFIVKGYYPNGKMRLLGSSKTHTMPLNLQDAFYDFFPNGHRSRMRTFENGEPVGNIVEYYPNGELYSVKTYVKNAQPFFQQCRDSTGVVLAENGKGIWKEFNGDFSTPANEGEVDKGGAQGVWVQKLNDSVTVKSNYKDGVLLSGNRIYKYKSDSTIYLKADTPAEFKGGLDGFLRYIGRKVRYPAIAREQNVQGRVVIIFVVEKDGYLSNIKIVKGIGGGCDEEAIRVVRLCPTWMPASINGKAVRLAYNVPIISTYHLINRRVISLREGYHRKCPIKKGMVF